MITRRNSGLRARTVDLLASHNLDLGLSWIACICTQLVAGWSVVRAHNRKGVDFRTQRCSSHSQGRLDREYGQEWSRFAFPGPRRPSVESSSLLIADQLRPDVWYQSGFDSQEQPAVDLLNDSPDECVFAQVGGVFQRLGIQIVVQRPQCLDKIPAQLDATNALEEASKDNCGS